MRRINSLLRIGDECTKTNKSCVWSCVVLCRCVLVLSKIRGRYASFLTCHVGQSSRPRSLTGVRESELPICTNALVTAPWTTGFLRGGCLASFFLSGGDWEYGRESGMADGCECECGWTVIPVSGCVHRGTAANSQWQTAVYGALCHGGKICVCHVHTGILSCFLRPVRWVPGRW